MVYLVISVSTNGYDYLLTCYCDGEKENKTICARIYKIKGEGFKGIFAHSSGTLLTTQNIDDSESLNVNKQHVGRGMWAWS